MQTINANNKLLDSEKHNIMMLAEDYPVLKASSEYEALMEALVECEDHISASRRFYNSNVSVYNTRIQQFPYSILANNWHYAEMEYLKFEEEIKNSVRVDLNKENN